MDETTENVDEEIELKGIKSSLLAEKIGISNEKDIQ